MSVSVEHQENMGVTVGVMCSIRKTKVGINGFIILTIDLYSNH